MQRNGETGVTFEPHEIGWIDFESRSRESIKSGTYRYAVADSTNAIIFAFAIGEADARTVAVKNFPQTLTWADVPDNVKRHHERVERGEAVWAAWNAAFDRAIWNFACIDFPFMAPHHIIDVMAQAVTSGLAPDLATAAKQSGSTHKVESGKELIKLFCLPTSTATPLTHPAEWAEFCRYAGGDILAMRSVFQRTRQLPWVEWTHYWAGERINERGIAIDLKMVTHAARLAEKDKVHSNRELTSLTNGAVTTVDQVARMTNWLLDRLPPSGRDVLFKREEEVDDDGVTIRPAKHSLTRKQVERLIALLVKDQ